MKYLLLLGLLVCLYTIEAQNKFTSDDYRKKPVWIQMMQEEHPNYHEVVKAYNTYWETHTPPVGEGDMDKKRVKENNKRFTRKEVAQAREDAAMRMAIKRYHWWIARMEPFVQDDGSILRPNPKQ